MHESSLEYLRCVNCKSELELDVFIKTDEIEEEILLCNEQKLEKADASTSSSTDDEST